MATPAVPLRTSHGNATGAYLPQNLAKGITAILGLTNYSAFSTSSAKISSAVTQPNTSSTDPCTALTGLASDCNLPQDFAKSYKLNPLTKNGAEGQGKTIAIVTLAALDQGAPEYFWKNVEGLPKSSANRTVTVDNIDGGPGAPSYDAGSSETDLDVEQSGGLAPDASVIDYQAPNTDSGFADAFFQAATDDSADAVSTSWGESETIVQEAVASGEETSAYNAAYDEAFLELAAQGQSAFDATGDAGAYEATADLGTTNLSIDDSSDSPYITAAGGTTLPWAATLTSSTTGNSAAVDVTAERIWGWDYLWQPVATLDNITLLASAEEQIAGGTGGYSVLEPEPSYQKGVPGTTSFTAVNWLNSIAYQNVGGGLKEPTDFSINATPPTVTGSGSGRETPDLAADADPYTGYLEYSPSFTDSDGPGPALEGGWGGTSFVAPQLAGSAVGDRLLARPPCRALEPDAVQVRDELPFAVHLR